MFDQPPFIAQKSVVSEKKKDEKEEEEEDEDIEEPSTKRLMMLNRPEFPIMAFGAVCAAAFGCVMPCFSIIFAEMLNVCLPFCVQSVFSAWACSACLCQTRACR